MKKKWKLTKRQLFFVRRNHSIFGDFCPKIPLFSIHSSNYHIPLKNRAFGIQVYLPKTPKNSCILVPSRIDRSTCSTWFQIYFIFCYLLKVFCRFPFTCIIGKHLIFVCFSHLLQWSFAQYFRRLGINSLVCMDCAKN